jgi:hypothetical protein
MPGLLDLMNALELFGNGAGAAALLYACTIAMAAISAVASPDPKRRRAARRVLALLVRNSQDSNPR